MGAIERKTGASEPKDGKDEIAQDEVAQAARERELRDLIERVEKEKWRREPLKRELSRPH
jgi:hypothetical protein